MHRCPLVEVRECLHLSALELAQLAGVTASRVYDTEAGRIPTIPAAVLRALEPFTDVKQLVEEHARWFQGLSEAVRARAGAKKISGSTWASGCRMSREPYPRGCGRRRPCP